MLSMINPIPKLKQLLQKNLENDPVCPNDTTDNTNDFDLNDDEWILIEDEIDIEIEDGDMSWEEISPTNNPWISTCNGFTEVDVKAYLKARADAELKKRIEKEQHKYEKAIQEQIERLEVEPREYREAKERLEQERKQNHENNVECNADFIKQLIQTEYDINAYNDDLN